jgi:arginase
MSVAFLMGLHNTLSISGFDWLKPVPRLSPSRIVYIGLRDLDVGEKKMIKVKSKRNSTILRVSPLMRFGCCV